MTPPAICNSFPLPVTHLTAVEPPRDRRRVASLHFRDCTAVVLRRHGGDGGVTAGGTAVMEVLQRSLYGAKAVMAVPRRPHCGLAQPAVALRSFEHVQSFHRATANVRAVLTVFGAATAINDGITAEPRRSWRCHCGLDSYRGGQTKGRRTASEIDSFNVVMAFHQLPAFRPHLSLILMDVLTEVVRKEVR